MEFGRGPNARTEGYSINGSQAKSVALNPGGILRGGNRISVSRPVRIDSWAAARRAPSRAAKMQSNPFMPADGLAAAMEPEPQGGFNQASQRREIHIGRPSAAHQICARRVHHRFNFSGKTKYGWRGRYCEGL